MPGGGICPCWPCANTVYAAIQVYLTAAAALLAYQTLDNMDGKQARRTGSSSPLGQLFDHGCDAFNTTASGLNLAAALQVRRLPISVDV